LEIVNLLSGKVGSTPVGKGGPTGVFFAARERGGSCSSEKSKKKNDRKSGGGAERNAQATVGKTPRASSEKDASGGKTDAVSADLKG